MFLCVLFFNSYLWQCIYVYYLLCLQMVDLLEGAYEDQVENFTVVDCRYPYEFEGGHIQGAINPFTKDQISDTFVKSDKYRQQPNSPHKRNIIIFHCEFSSERGPKMSRFLRNIDRDANKHCYPSLNYPEVYLLDSGYKAFYEHSKVNNLIHALKYMH